MTAFTALYGEVLSEVPGADRILVGRSFLRAARTFCEKTLVLEATTDPWLDITADEPVYTLPAVSNREIVRVKRSGVFWGDDEQQVYERSEDQLDLDAGDPKQVIVPDSSNSLQTLTNISDPWRKQTAAEPIFFYQPRPDRIRLVPIPNASYSAKLKVTYHLKPRLGATEVDDFVLASWYEVLVRGALGELLQIPKKPWTDSKLGIDYERRFMDDIDGIVSDRVSGFASQDYSAGRTRSWP